LLPAASTTPAYCARPRSQPACCPARPGDLIKTPLDDTLPPNDVDFFLLGKTEVTRAEARNLTPVSARIDAADSRPFTGHMLDMPRSVSDASVQ